MSASRFTGQNHGLEALWEAMNAMGYSIQQLLYRAKRIVS